MSRIRAAIPIVLMALAAHRAFAQPDVQLSVELRSRLEAREGVTFGKDPDRSADFIRSRFGITYKPVSWLKFGGMVQDARAPWYGAGAPFTVRDPADLHEAYAEVRADEKRGFGLSAGRRMLNYGDARLIGVPNWSNVARTFDHARVWYRAGSAQYEILFLSSVKQVSGFNWPQPGDRVWGTYNTLPELRGGHRAEVYLLRHDQNRPGGFAGTGTVGVNTVGSRWTGPVAAGWKYTIEGVLQGGHVGPASHRAGAWSSVLSRKVGVVNLSGEYKYASGTGDPSVRTRSGTFDQLYAANHDKFGHEDLFGWRNIHNVRAVATWTVRPSVTLNLMYDSLWLASVRDALYAGSGRAIAVSPDGRAGRHVGQEWDLFATWRPARPLQFGAGVATFVKGEFIRNVTPGVSPRYAYVAFTYTY